VVVARALRQGREIGGFLDGQLVDRLVEIGQRSGGDAVGVQAPEDLVEIKLENPVLGIGLLDAEGEDGFLDLALVSSGRMTAGSSWRPAA
jgi:hypothetical protein